ncbi:MAG: lysophospholipase [Bacteroidetes bacterium]|nr:lysophospholipase [Bacteroidota bacterium]
MNHFEWNWTQDGTRFYAQGWSPVNTKAVICLVHGFAEYSGRYAHVAERLGREGYAVLAFDQYGHGHTEGPRGFSPSLDASLDSIKIILDEAETRFPGVPKFLYGHSMGGNMVLNYLLRRKPKIAGAIATAPWLKLGFDPPAIKLLLARIMRVIYPKWPEKADLDASAISRDKAEVRKYETDPLIHNTARAGTFFDTYNAGKWALEHASEVNVPLLLLHGTEDKLIAFAGSEQFAANGPKDLITFKPYQGFYHELHNEPAADRERIFLDEIAWLNSKV